ncbi:MAG: hypothetical protein ACE5F5_08925 [Acidimicrobiia bacterium]
MASVLTSLVLVVATLAVTAPTVSEEPVKPAEHCVIFVIGEKPDGEFITTDQDCFSTREAAAVWATVGMSTVSGIGGGGGSAFSTFTLGIHYDWYWGLGSSITIVGSSCTGGYWNTTPSWDNRISSSYNGCYKLRHWDDPGKQGTVENTTGSGTNDNLTYMNNKAESISYHSS